jgi:hypothetical protein
MGTIYIHQPHPANPEESVTAFTFTVDYADGKRVKFTDLPIPPSSDANSIAAFRQELRRLASALLDVADSGSDIHWDPPGD